MEGIIDWIKGILGCILVMSLVMQGCSGKAYRPYLRLFVGIVLILTVLSPITERTGIDNCLDDWMEKLAFQENEELTDKLLQADGWLEDWVTEQTEEATEGGVSVTEKADIQIEIEVEIEALEPIVPAVGVGGEKDE